MIIFSFLHPLPQFPDFDPPCLGKTTLLDALFGTLPKKALLTGKIRKWPIDRELVREIRPDLVLSGSEGTSVAYIPQHDLFYETLTLQEHLNFQVTIYNHVTRSQYPDQTYYYMIWGLGARQYIV